MTTLYSSVRNNPRYAIACAIMAVVGLIAGLMVIVSPTARADAGEGVGGTYNGEFYGSYDIGEDNGGGQVWCVDYGKAEPMANGGVKYGEPEKMTDVDPADMRILVYALQEGKRAIDEGNQVLAAAVSAAIHASGTNAGAPFNEDSIPPEVRPDYERIIKDAPDVPEGTYLTARTPEEWTPGGKEGYQRVLDYDQIQTGVIEVMKVDATNKSPLANAEFTILGEDGQPIVDPQVTKENGTYRIQVNPGKYTVMEGKAPEGYLLNGTGAEENSKEVTIEPNKAMRVTFANRPIPTITINKVDDSGQPLSGAKLRLSVARGDDEGTRLMDFVSDGRPVVAKVLPGEYVVEELEAPEGYNKEPEKIKVTVDRDSNPKVTVVNTKIEETSVAPPATTTEEAPKVETVPPTTESTTPEVTTTPEVATPSATVQEAPPATPSISSQARIQDDNYLTQGGKVLDTVFYTGLTPGKQYTLKATMVCNPDGKATSNTGELTFTPESADGQIDVPVAINDAGCPVQTVYEELLADGQVVAEHKDINDQAQTVGMLKPVEKKPRVVIQSIPSGSY